VGGSPSGSCFARLGFSKGSQRFGADNPLVVHWLFDRDVLEPKRRVIEHLDPRVDTVEVGGVGATHRAGERAGIFATPPPNAHSTVATSAMSTAALPSNVLVPLASRSR
jgi:hypothetical protein